jgi:hypothetical protein
VYERRDEQGLVMQELLDSLKKRLEELRTAEAQQIHALGVVAGRIDEIVLLIQRLESELLLPTVEN